MRVTFVLPAVSPRPSGGFRIIYEYANRLTKRGHNVTVVHPAVHPRVSLVERWTRPAHWRHRIERRRARGGVAWMDIDPGVDLRTIRQLSPRSFPPADVICATAWQTAPSVFAAAPHAGAKCSLIQHYETWDGPKAEVDATWRYAMTKIVISKWLRQTGLDLGVPADELVYIPNGMDLEFFRIEQPIEGRGPLVGLLIHRSEWKGSEYGLRALESARKEIPDLRAIAFGTEPRPPSIPDWIEYRENLSGDQLRAFYNSLAAYLHPSLMEGWPLPPAEAMACGAVVVAADNPGVLDYVEDGRTALVAPRRDSNALAAALVRVLSDRDLRWTLARAGNESIQQYTWSRAADELEATFVRLSTTSTR